MDRFETENLIMPGPKSMQRYSRRGAYEPTPVVSVSPVYRPRQGLVILADKHQKGPFIISGRNRDVDFLHLVAGGPGASRDEVAPHRFVVVRRAAAGVHLAGAGGIPSYNGWTLYA